MKRPTSLGARHGLTVLAIGALALAACSGGGSGSSGVASLSDSAKKTASNGSGSGRATSTTEFRTQLLAYAKCMRDNGVDFPDPQFDSNGRPQFTRRSTPGQGQGGNFADLRNSPTFAKARTACQSKQPDFAGQFQRTPAEQAAARKNLLKFAKCMRSKGVDFPDPTFDANGRPEFNRDGAPGGAVGQLRNDPTARAAFTACQKVVGGNGRRGFGFGFGGGPGGPPPGAGGGGNGGSTGAAAGTN